MIFFAMPWLDRGAVKSIRYRGTTYKTWLALFVVSFLVLGYLGVVPVTVWGQFPESWPILGTADRATVVVAGADRRLLPVLPADAVVHRARQDQARTGEGDRMMNKLTAPLVALLLLAAVGLAGPAAASGGADIRARAGADQPARRRVAAARRADVRQLLPQLPYARRYMRYNRLTDIGIDVAMIQDNLMFATDKVGNTMTVAMTAKDGKAWFGAPPPDLTVEARVRGAEWLYNYFLALLQGRRVGQRLEQSRVPERRHAARAVEAGRRNRLVSTYYDDHEDALAATIAVKGSRCWRRRRTTSTSWRRSPSTSPGTMTPAQYKSMVADLVNYLDFMAEPTKNRRINLGIIVLLYLGVLFVIRVLDEARVLEGHPLAGPALRQKRGQIRLSR